MMMMMMMMMMMELYNQTILEHPIFFVVPDRYHPQKFTMVLIMFLLYAYFLGDAGMGVPHLPKCHVTLLNLSVSSPSTNSCSGQHIFRGTSLRLKRYTSEIWRKVIFKKTTWVFEASFQFFMSRKLALEPTSCRRIYAIEEGSCTWHYCR